MRRWWGGLSRGNSLFPTTLLKLLPAPTRTRFVAADFWSFLGWLGAGSPECASVDAISCHCPESSHDALDLLFVGFHCRGLFYGEGLFGLVAYFYFEEGVYGGFLDVCLEFTKNPEGFGFVFC